MKRRAEHLDETRRRIVDAAVKLHTTVGPGRTTISAIAGLAGVERLTVYRHFPTVDDLFRACTRQHAADCPPPDPAPWAGIHDPKTRLRTALTELYAYYARPDSGLDAILPDLRLEPGWVQAMVEQRQRQMVVVLRRGWPAGPMLRPAISHAIDFYTFRSLVRQQGLAVPRATDLMIRLVEASTQKKQPA